MRCIWPDLVSNTARISMLLHAYCIYACTLDCCQMTASSTGTSFRIRVKVGSCNVDLTIEGPSEREAMAFAFGCKYWIHIQWSHLRTSTEDAKLLSRIANAAADDTAIVHRHIDRIYYKRSITSCTNTSKQKQRHLIKVHTMTVNNYAGVALSAYWLTSRDLFHADRLLPLSGNSAESEPVSAYSVSA